MNNINTEKEIKQKPKLLDQNFIRRAGTALTAGTLAVGMIISSAWGLFICCLVISMLGIYEFFKLLNLDITRFETIFTLVFSLFVWAALAISLYSGSIKFEFICIGLLALPIISIILLYKKTEMTAVQTMSLLAFSQIYILLPFLLYFISAFNIKYQAFDHYEFRIPLGILFLHWVSDTAAYFAGKFVGRRSLFPRISPKKTWEGFAGGLFGNIILGWIFETYWTTTAFNWIIIGFIVAVMGLYGDLVESMIKRNLKVKDSGGILPGHGGILDRFDGFFLAMPSVFVFQLLFGK